MGSVRWVQVLAAVFVVLAVAGGIVFMPPLARMCRTETEVSYTQLSRTDRPSGTGEYAAVFDASMGGALGDVYTEVYVLSSSDSLPGSRKRRVWHAEYPGNVRVRWSSTDTLDVLVDDGWLEANRERVHQRPRVGVHVRTIGVSDAAPRP